MFNLLVVITQALAIASAVSSSLAGDITGITVFFSILMTTAAAITAVYFGDYK